MQLSCYTYGLIYLHVTRPRRPALREEAPARRPSDPQDTWGTVETPEGGVGSEGEEIEGRIALAHLSWLALSTWPFLPPRSIRPDARGGRRWPWLVMLSVLGAMLQGHSLKFTSHASAVIFIVNGRLCNASSLNSSSAGGVLSLPPA